VASVNDSSLPVAGFSRFQNILLDRLTPAERRVAMLLIEGFSNKEISTHLGRAEPTVKHQTQEILRACGVPSRARFIAAYYQQLLCSMREGEESDRRKAMGE
jgi:DNA-binding NarL/FixJ family response regulator